MTKDEIKKALECCSKTSISFCKNCPYNNNGKFSCCDGEMCKDALNLINEQEKEIKQLKTECTLLDDELRNARQETINVLNKLKGNIKNAIDTYYNSQGGGYYLAEDVINDIEKLIKEAQND